MAGRVILVGAGPGDPDLMTVKAVRALAAAEVVVYDRLVSQAILALAPPSAELVDVGKQAGSHPVPQSEINAILVRLAASGRIVVRLKGGDPFMFGRGGEEALALKSAGLAFEVVPGITAAQGCAASLNLPLTHRAVATGVRYVTGHCRGEEALDLDWAGLADPTTTLVVYMGLAHIREIAQRLIAHGRSPDVPVAAVSRGTQPGQRHIVSTLARIADDATAARLASPIAFIVGEVVDIARLLRTDSHDTETAIAVAAE